MLIHADQRTGKASALEGEAHIVIVLDAKGDARLKAFFRGVVDSSYAPMGDDRLVQRELPKLLGELRAQLVSLS